LKNQKHWINALVAGPSRASADFELFQVSMDVTEVRVVLGAWFFVFVCFFFVGKPNNNSLRLFLWYSLSTVRVGASG
jgi:hypothetical protein